MQARSRWRARSRLILPGALAAGLLLATAVPAAAHEDRRVGEFEFTVGWGDEPTYAGAKNSVSLFIANADGTPYIDLQDTLNVEVSFGDQTVTLPITPNFRVGAFGEPGDYGATILPTRSGEYSFHFVGTVGGQAIDETFTSSETTFDNVNDPSEIAFPVQDPSTGELADRIDRETARVEEAASAAADAVDQADNAKDDAGSARGFGIAGLALGAVALAVGGTGLARRR